MFITFTEIQGSDVFSVTKLSLAMFFFHSVSHRTNPFNTLAYSRTGHIKPESQQFSFHTPSYPFSLLARCRKKVRNKRTTLIGKLVQNVSRLGNRAVHGTQRTSWHGFDRSLEGSVALLEGEAGSIKKGTWKEGWHRTGVKLYIPKQTNYLRERPVGPANRQHSLVCVAPGWFRRVCYIALGDSR